jgi:hypothetical protein
MAAQSIAPAKIIDNSIGSTGVRMVESVPILDTSDVVYNLGNEAFCAGNEKSRRQ